MKNKLAAILTGGILTLTTGILPSYALTATTSVSSNNLHQRTSLIKDYSKILISQATAGNILGRRRTTTFKANRSTRQFRVRRWKWCFRGKGGARVRVSSGNTTKTYTSRGSKDKCILFKPSGRVWRIKNIGNTTISYHTSS